MDLIKCRIIRILLIFLKTAVELRNQLFKIDLKFFE